MAPTIAELYSPATWNESGISPFVNALHFGTAFWMNASFSHHPCLSKKTSLIQSKFGVIGYGKEF